MVRFLSTVHASKKDRTIAEAAWSTAFSREHFPKTFAATCMLSFGIGFCGMHRWQQNRQLKWEQQQEKLEVELYNIRKTKMGKEPVLSNAESI
jgi:D-lyxose ketol-isomerase